MPLSTREEDEVVALIAETLAEHETLGTYMARGHMIVAALEEAGWEITWRDPGPTFSMHRHHEYVDHSEADHDHGACSEHAHWAGGTHTDAPFERATPSNDPLGDFIAQDIAKVIDLRPRWS